jgi:hypothetical protein
MAQHHNVTRMANKPICIHLSNQIKLNQFSLGKEEPGNVSSTNEIINQMMAGIKEGLMLFREFFLNALGSLFNKNFAAKYCYCPNIQIFHGRLKSSF